MTIYHGSNQLEVVDTNHDLTNRLKLEGGTKIENTWDAYSYDSHNYCTVRIETESMYSGSSIIDFSILIFNFKKLIK